MPTWLILAKSPVFRFALTLLLLGLLRLAFHSLVEMNAAVRRASDRRIPYFRIIGETISWTLPVLHIHRTRRLYSFASMSFHLGILAAGLFLGNHIDILQANFGLAWFSVGKPVLDILTLLTLASGSFLFIHRIYNSSSRKLSKTMDYLLLALILNIFLSGYLGGQAWNPIPYDSLMLFHTINGILLLALIPFTKIAHCVLYPLIRLGTEIAWHFPAQGGCEVVKSLHGPDGRRI